jgi:hypothetical protein
VQQDYSFTHRTVLSPAPAGVVIGAARAGFRSISHQLTKVGKEEHAYDFERDRPRMRETKARFAATGAELLDVERFQMDAEPTPKSVSRSRTAETLLKRILSVRVSNVPAPSWAVARET